MFVMPKSGEAKDMVDAQGRPYVKLANAFRYRKIPAGSCSCKPDPWDDEARARHERLAAHTSDPAHVGQERPPAKSGTNSEDERETSNTPVVEPMTLADVQSLGLAGGLVQAGSGQAPDDKLADKPETNKVATEPSAPSAPSAKTTVVAETADTTAARRAGKPGNTAEAKRPSYRAKPETARLRVAATHHRPSPRLIVPGQYFAPGPYPMPVRYPAQRYVVMPGPNPYVRAY